MSNEVVNKKNTEVAVINFEEYAGRGSDNFEKDDLTTPFLKILQKNSPQVDEDNAAYIEGAKAGMFYNTATGEVYPSPVRVVPVAYMRDFLKWKDLDSGGGFEGSVSREYAENLEQDERGRFVVDNDTYVEDTRVHFVIILTDTGPQPAVLSLTSSMIKASRNWNNTINRMLIPGTNTKAPSFAFIYELQSTAESKDSYTWKGLKVSTNPVLVEDPAIFQAAVTLSDSIESGATKADHSKAAPANESAGNDDENEEF